MARNSFGDIEVYQQRRRATVTQNKWSAAHNNLKEGTHTCHVLGLFQVENDVEVNPYFICEMDDGRCIYAEPTQVRFIDTDDKGEIVNVTDSY